MNRWLHFLLGFNLFFLQSYLLRFSFFSYSTYFQEWAVLLTLFIFVWTRGVRATLRSFFRHPILLIFLSLTAVSLIFVPLLDLGEALSTLKFLFFAELLTFLFLEVYSSEDQRWQGLSLLAHGALFFGLFSVFYHLLGYNIQPDYRLSGPLDSAVYLAFYLAPAVLFFALRFFREPFSWKNIVAFLTVGILLLATRSFGSIGAVGLSIALFALFNSEVPLFRSRWFRAVLFVFFVLFSLGVFYVKILPTLQTHYSSLDERGEIWQSSVHLLSEPRSFVFGLGFGQFQVHYEAVVAEVLGREPLDYKVLQPHNLFLLFWVHFGLLGLLFISWAFLMLLWRILKRSAQGQVEVFSLFILLVFFIHGLIDTPFIKNDLLFLLILFLEVAFGPLLLRQFEKVFHKIRKFCA